MVAEAVKSVSSSKRLDAGRAEMSIAVLPFVNMSADLEQEYFSDGMTEEILNALANVPKLAVTARTSVFSLKGQKHDIREIGKMLGVTYVLEGSVRKAGNEVRVTAQLIRADNGFHLWSETYDRKLENVFDLQAELAGAIAKALELPLGMGGGDGLVVERTSNPEAYALFLQARAAYRERGQSVKKSIDLYRKALQLDPKFAPAWAGLSSSLAVYPWYVPTAERTNTPVFMKEAEKAGKQALELAPDLPQAHTALAMVYTFQWQWVLAEKHFNRALALAPNDPEVYYHYSDWLAAMGRLEEALRSAQKAVTLDPLVPIFLNGKANALGRLGRNEEEVAVRRAAYALAPDVPLFSNNLLRAYFSTKRTDDIEKLLNETQARDATNTKGDGGDGFSSESRKNIRAYISLIRDPSQREAARKVIGDEGLKAFDNRNNTAYNIQKSFNGLETSINSHLSGVDPVAGLRSVQFDNYRNDPRYIKLLNKVGFDDEGNIR